MRLRFILPLLATLLAFLPLAQGQNPSQQERPKPSQTRAESSASGEADADFALAQEYESSGATQLAIAAYRRVIRNFPTSKRAAQAQFRIAELLQAGGNLAKAFDAYQTLVTRYPDTPEFEKAVGAQIIIANQYLSGRQIKVLGFAMISSLSKASDMYAAILQNAPFSKNAPVAQFNLGLSFEKQGKQKEANDAYQRVLDKYPNSDIADDAMYQIGYVYMRIGLSGRSQDLSALILAKNTFEDFLLQFPKSEKAPQAKDNLAAIGGREAGDLMTIAKFYDRYKNYKAATIYYNDVIRRQPNTPNAELAKGRIEEMRSEYGEDALRAGPERAETGEKMVLRRRLQAQVETSALSDYAGPPKRDIVPDELPISKPKLRTNLRDVQPLPAVEPALPTE